jgi:hypothetical protein
LGWWAVGGVALGVVAVRWLLGPDPAPDRRDQVALAHAALRRRRRSAIGSAAEGPVRLVGRVSRSAAAGEPLVAPMSGRPCVYYEVVYPISQWRLMQRPNGTPVLDPSSRNRRAQSFVLTDDSGTAEIAFDDPADVTFEVAGGDGPPPETAIFLGDEVTVVGVGAREVVVGGESTGYRAPPTRYVVRGGSGSVLAILRKKQKARRR